MTRYDLAVVGAGPGGLAAALTAADGGLLVALIDGAPEAGGQFYRQTARRLRARRPERLHHAWSTWTSLRDRLADHRSAGRITFLTERHVWSVEPGDGAEAAEPGGFRIHALVGPEQTTSETVAASGLVLATGGYERVLPFPGWTLPGVLTAGGAQAMLKAGLALPGRRVVVAGSGPLLLPVASGLAAAGADVAGLYDSSDPRAFARHAAALVRNGEKLIEGAGYAARLTRHGVRIRFRHSITAAHGEDRVEAVTLAGPDGRERRIACDALAVSHGMLPHTEIAQTLGARLAADGSVAVDTEQRTGVENLWAAGETTGIGGASLSQAEGEIAGRSAAARLRDRAPAGLAAKQTRRRRLTAFAEVIQTTYTDPADWERRVTDETVLCRCEEVTAASVRESVSDLGATDLRTVKLLTRAGMGWCQGRICSPGVAGEQMRPWHQPMP
ncbi:FAD-dependent oxidoreductase, partial [Actinospica sp. MGRD01-02]